MTAVKTQNPARKRAARKRRTRLGLTYVFLTVFGGAMVYPLIWLFFGSFKGNNELFTSLGLLPQKWVTTAYRDGWASAGQYTFSTFFLNTFQLVLPTVIFTVISSAVVAYGFSRFEFPCRKLCFSIMIMTLMLPQAVVIIPRYILFRNFGWLNSYLPFIVPAVFATAPFFVFMMVQFFRGIPKALDEAAYIDGCGPVQIFLRILLPLSKPALFSATIFQFMWTWNDFFNCLIYIDSVKKFPLSLALRITLDSTGATIEWNQILAMSVVSIIPLVLLFFFAQKYFVEGVATTGIKG